MFIIPLRARQAAIAVTISLYPARRRQLVKASANL
jgi:hypothetical protein